jgi:hypothetical protein
MKRSVAKAYGSRLPSQIAQIFGLPPLIAGEDPRLYKELFLLLADEHEPRNIGDWLLVKDLADLQWERLRERQLKAEVIEIYQKRPSDESDEQITYVMRPSDADL